MEVLIKKIIEILITLTIYQTKLKVFVKGSIEIVLTLPFRES